jgi:hypothetical protein
MLIQVYQGTVRDSFPRSKVSPGAHDGLPRGKVSSPHPPSNVSPPGNLTLAWEMCPPPI